MDNNGPYIKGFRFCGIHAGIKEEVLDLALIVSDVPSRVAALFTKNRLKAAPVLLDMERVKGGVCRAIVANSGCANACTGQEGLEDALLMARWTAKALSLPEEEVLVASTGVIGERLPMDRIRDAIPRAVQGLSADGFLEAARAIMTTDTRPKVSYRRLTLNGYKVTVAGMAKGAGMIEPNMATMLCFIVSDVACDLNRLKRLLRGAVEHSFNAISVDGDMSTNDTVILLANGASGMPELRVGSPEIEAFQEALEGITGELAKMLVMDGEGATKLIEVRVEGARSRDDARKIAYRISRSPLVKTAFFGEDVNWGRIMAAIGSSGVDVDPTRIGIWYGDVQVVRKGMGTGLNEEAKAIIKRREFTLRVELGLGGEDFILYTCDLSPDYVTINASYTT